MSMKLGRVVVGKRINKFTGEAVEQTRLQIRCDCGEILICDGFTNTCSCGADYNMSGQRLASRKQWGEETGETADEILQAEAAGFPEVDY